jgi:hypothetical protein
MGDLFPGSAEVEQVAGLQILAIDALAVGYKSFWLANRADGIYRGGKVMIASNGSQGNHVGQETDIQAQSNPGRHTLVDLAFGPIFPGEFLRKAGRGSAYKCLFLGVSQRF